MYYVDIDAVILHSASTTASTFPDCPGIPGAFHFMAAGSSLLYCAKFKDGLLSSAEKSPAASAVHFFILQKQK